MAKDFCLTLPVPQLLRLLPQLLIFSCLTGSRVVYLGHEEGDGHDLRRGLLLVFDVRVVCWRTGHMPRWVVLRGMDELVQGVLTGNLQATMLYDGDRMLEGEILEAPGDSTELNVIIYAVLGMVPG